MPGTTNRRITSTAISKTLKSPKVRPQVATVPTSTLTVSSGEARVCDEKAVRRGRKALSTQLPPHRAASFAAMMSAFADETRLRTLFLLAQGELCVCDLAILLEISQSGVSHQLRSLRTQGLVKVRRDGRNAYYSVADDHVAEILRIGMEHLREKKTR